MLLVSLRIMNKGKRKKHEGFIPLFRRFLDNQLWTEKRKFSKAEAWIDLLFMARYGVEPEKIIDRGELIVIKQDEILTSHRTLAKKWGWSKKKTTDFLKCLSKSAQIVYQRKDHRRSIIKIINLSKYRCLVTGINPQKRPQKAHRLTHRKPTDLPHKNKDNKDNKDNKVKNTKVLVKTKTIIKKEFGNELVNHTLMGNLPKRVSIVTQMGNKKLPKWEGKKDNIKKTIKENTTSKEVVRKTYGNKDINFLIKYLKEKLKLPMLDGSEKQNRRYCWLTLKKFGGKKKVKLLIEVTARDDFWATKIASFQQLYYKGVQIISKTRKKGGENGRSKIAFINPK